MCKNKQQLGPNTSMEKHMIAMNLCLAKKKKKINQKGGFCFPHKVQSCSREMNGPTMCLLLAVTFFFFKPWVVISDKYSL